LCHARDAIAEQLGATRQPSVPQHDALAQPGATFVTLMQRGELRGCIGSLEAFRSLGVDVRANAVAAAFRDPRFPPLQRADYESTDIEVSLLGPARPLAATDEGDLLRRLRPGIDGVIVECDGRRATFLPQVWEALPDPVDFLAALKRKAGLPADFWSPRLNVHCYAVVKWKEGEKPVAERVP
jgi:hypothetical protein